MLITVAICTWNRARSLDRTLASMHGLRIPDNLEWELLVIDNNCVDETREVVARHATSVPLRLVVESEQGVSYARNRAIVEAAGEFIIYADDDVLVDANWLAEYSRAFRLWPDAVYYGGTITPCFPFGPPRYLRDFPTGMTFAYGQLQLGDDMRPFADHEEPLGGNMAFRTAGLNSERFDNRLGMKASDSLFGEESDLFRRLRAKGCGGVWVGTACVQHIIPREHVTPQYLWKRYRGYGRTMVRLEEGPAANCLWGAPRWAIRKYCESYLLAWCLSPLKSSAWFRAYSTAATCRGIIEESRSQQKTRVGSR